MSLSAKRSAYSDMPSFSSQSAICCIGQSPRDRAYGQMRISHATYAVNWHSSYYRPILACPSNGTEISAAAPIELSSRWARKMLP